MFASTWLQLTAAVSNNSLSAVARIYIQVSGELATIVNIVDCRNSSGRAIFDPVVALNAGYARVEFGSGPFQPFGSPPRVLFVYEQNLAINSPRFQSGRPSTRLAMMLRCTSFVPP